jgi:hypothetical protein
MGIESVQIGRRRAAVKRLKKDKLLQKNRIAAAFGVWSGVKEGRTRFKLLIFNIFNPFPKSFKILPEGLWVMDVWAAGGLSLGCPRSEPACPAGLRWLPRSPPRRAGSGRPGLAGNPAQSLPRAAAGLGRGGGFFGAAVLDVLKRLL